MLTTNTPLELPTPRVKVAVKALDQTRMEHMMVIYDPKNKPI